MSSFLSLICIRIRVDPTVEVSVFTQFSYVRADLIRNNLNKMIMNCGGRP